MPAAERRSPSPRLDPPADVRAELWRRLARGIESYLAEVPDLGAAPVVDHAEVQEALAAFDPERPLDARDALDRALDALRRLQPHSRHPRSFGLFEAAPTVMGVVGDALAATFNPCLASRAGSPFGVATEQRLVDMFARRFGYRPSGADGIVTTGGSEANHAALLLALTRGVPRYLSHGLLGAERRPVLYASPEVHPSVPKAARMAGLGSASLRQAPTDPELRLDPGGLERLIRADLDEGRQPCLLVLTAGTTGAGVIDPIAAGSEIAERYGLWLHVDAAWGGAAALLDELRPAFDGLERADSLAFDPHKWLSVPLGAGLLLTRHRGMLGQAFGVDETFLPDANPDEPYARSMRWSRSFAALKVLLSLAVAGWRGYEEALRHQVHLGEVLRRQLTTSAWRIVNRTPLPVVCFDAGEGEEHDHADPSLLEAVAQTVNSSGAARIALVRVGRRLALRACVTNHATTESDVTALVDLVDRARDDVRRRRGWR